MSGKVNLRENGILDEDLPTLLENVFKCLSKNLNLVYMENDFNNEIMLRDDIVIPNEICDRFVCFDFDFDYIFIESIKYTYKNYKQQHSSMLFCLVCLFL